jgi:alpha-N-arabinofuranosidase
MTSMRKIILITGFFGLLIYCAYLIKCRIDPVLTTIMVDVTQANGTVNRKLLGQNLLGYASEWEPFTQYSDFGAGLWDGKRHKIVKEPINLAKDIRISTVRFPGGGGSYEYDWKKAIEKNRQAFLFGVDEFMQVAGELSAEPVFTLSYFTDGPKDAADLVEYLNSPADSRHPWALKRADKRLREPYGVKYFEVGNEIYDGNGKDVKSVSPKQYAYDVRQYYDAMKKVDPQMQVGVVLHTDDWNNAVSKIIQDKIDFGIVHIYPTPVWGERLEALPAYEIFASSLALPVIRYDAQLKALRTLLRKSAGKDVPILVTEFNGGFAQDKPVPYRHCLGNALVNAELIRVFMNPANNVLMAHHWNFINEYWGIIANGFNGKYEDLYKPYYKRPNYYVFELYHKHFGDILLGVDVKCDSYRISIQDVPYLSVNASKSKNGKKIFLMVINKNMKKSVTSTIGLKGFTLSKDGRAWILNGPSIDATNEQNHDNVKVVYKTFEIKHNPFEFIFEPHSLTAIEIERAKN